MPDALDFDATFQSANTKRDLCCLRISVPLSFLKATCAKDSLDLVSVAHLHSGGIEEDEHLYFALETTIRAEGIRMKLTIRHPSTYIQAFLSVLIRQGSCDKVRTYKTHLRPQLPVQEKRHTCSCRTRYSDFESGRWVLTWLV